MLDQSTTPVAVGTEKRAPNCVRNRKSRAMMNSKLCLPKEVNFSQVRKRGVFQAEECHVCESRWNLRVRRCGLSP